MFFATASSPVAASSARTTNEAVARRASKHLFMKEDEDGFILSFN
jgi:hypothetical protein